MENWLEEFVKLYDKLETEGEHICPVAHTYITAHISILIDEAGNFLCAMVPEIKGELIPVPCTQESESRTSGVAPHLLHDQICYVSPYPKYEDRYKKYIAQLESYINQNPKDKYATAIYAYVKKGSLLNDISGVDKTSLKNIPDYKLNIIFCVYGMDNEGIDHQWTDYYLSTLSTNGVCCVTGKKDYIPTSYPACITSPGGMERLFMSGTPVGYIASQKIIHALQYLIYGKKNADRVEAEYNIKEFIAGRINQEELKGWVDENYPGSWDDFIKLLNTPD